MKRLTIYSRADCHLCDVMLAAVQAHLHGRAEVRVVDIDTDDALRRRYGIRIPVLVGDDQELCQYRLDVAALERYLCRGGG